MGYYVRILSTSKEHIPAEVLRTQLRKEKHAARLTVESGTEDEWDQVLLSHDDGTEIASIERNPVSESSLAAEELDEFRDEIADGKPASAVPWLLDFFDRVQCIYSCQLLFGTDHLNGWDVFECIKIAIWERATSIFQADGEGFSNEDGYHILWQFNDSVDGDWWMGVLKDGNWIHYQMDLANPQHRQEFVSGRVPKGVKLA